MSHVVRIAVLLMLAVAAWKVYDARAIRAELAVGEPERVAAMQARLDGVPLHVGAWSGERMPLPPGGLIGSGAECYVRTRYTRSNDEAVVLYIGGAAHFEERLHTPSFCLPAHGWELREFGDVPFFSVDGVSSDLTMSRILAEYGHQRMVTYYWLMVTGGMAEARWGQRLQRLLDLLAGRKASDAYLVILYVPVADAVSSSEATAQAFAEVMLPHLRTLTDPME